MARTILFIHPGAIGDVMLALSAIRSVRASFPHHACGLMAGGPVSRLLLACGEIDRVYPLEQSGLAGLLAGAEESDPDLRSWLGRADLVVGWMRDEEGQLAATFRTLGAGRVILRSPFDQTCTGVHQADRYLDTVASVAAVGQKEKPLQLPDAVLKEGAGILAELGVEESQAVALLHPGSGSRHKRCSPDLFVELVAQLQAWSVAPVLLAGPAEIEQAHAICLACPTQPALCEGVDLPVAAGLAARAALYVGHDSGFTHVAASLAVPTIALFGPTDPVRWASRGGHVQLLRGAPCACQDWAEVRACRDKPCLQVPPEQVVAACSATLGDQAKRPSSGLAGRPSPCHA